MAMQNYGGLTRRIMAYVKMVNGINSANLFCLVQFMIIALQNLEMCLK